MTTKQNQITVNGLVVDVERKKVKHLRVTVYPPDGRVRVAVPLRVSDAAVRQFIMERMEWIQKHRVKFQARPREIPLEYVSGESVPFQGSRLLLNVTYDNTPPQVTIRDDTYLDITVQPGSNAAYREAVLNAWYRYELKKLIPPLIRKWEPVVGVSVAEWGVRQMKTRWGSCNIQARRIWLNLELVKKSPACLEYVVVHELVHLLERYHNARFYGFMDRFLPPWRQVRDELNRGTPGSADWEI